MNIEGRLAIRLAAQSGYTTRPDRLTCTISSTRPLHISQLFVGKPIHYLLQTVPLLFNICAMAQTTAAVRATEQALGRSACPVTEQLRDVLVGLESLREQCWQLMLSSARALEEDKEQQVLADLTRDIQTLSRLLHDPAADRNLFALRADAPAADYQQLTTIWHRLRHLLEEKVLAAPFTVWLDDRLDITVQVAEHHSAPTRFIHWLQGQSWADSGKTFIAPLPEDTPETDHKLLQRFNTAGIDFTRAPDWQGEVCEVSHFSQLQQYPLISTLLAQRGNGLYTRSVARLLSIATLIARLDGFFTGTAANNQSTALPARLNYLPKNTGLAHVNAARGKLTHHIVLATDQQTVKQFNILAPTEWNFHPHGVAAQALEHLHLDRHKPDTLEQQARLMIDAIDPCVGYDLSIGHEDSHHA